PAVRTVHFTASGVHRDPVQQRCRVEVGQARSGSGGGQPVEHRVGAHRVPVVGVVAGQHQGVGELDLADGQLGDGPLVVGTAGQAAFGEHFVAAGVGQPGGQVHDGDDGFDARVVDRGAAVDDDVLQRPADRFRFDRGVQFHDDAVDVAVGGQLAQQREEVFP